MAESKVEKKENSSLEDDSSGGLAFIRSVLENGRAFFEDTYCFSFGVVLMRNPNAPNLETHPCCMCLVAMAPSDQVLDDFKLQQEQCHFASRLKINAWRAGGRFEDGDPGPHNCLISFRFFFKVTEKGVLNFETHTHTPAVSGLRCGLGGVVERLVVAG